VRQCCSAAGVERQFPLAGSVGTHRRESDTDTATQTMSTHGGASVLPPPSTPSRPSPGIAASPARALQPAPALLWLSIHCGAEIAADSQIQANTATQTKADGNEASTAASASAAPGPSAYLRSVFALHTPDPTSVISEMIRKLSERVILPHDATTTPMTDVDSTTPGTVGTVSSDWRRSIAIRLYYAILENIIASETARMKSKTHAIQQLQPQQQPSATQSTPAPPVNFSSWLFSKAFHASILSIAFEVVLFSYSFGQQYLWPYTMEKLDVSCWDFLKHLEIAVKHLPSALPGPNPKNEVASPPPVLKQYLKRIENECILWKVWQKRSPVIKLLEEQEKSLMSSKPANSSISEMQVESKDGDASMSASSDDTSNQKSAEVAPASRSIPSSSPGIQTHAGVLSPSQCKSFDLFSRQLLTLAADRLSYMCSSSALNVSNLWLEGCWELLLECILSHTNLLYDRHLDTIILCCLYNILVKVAAGLPPEATLHGQGQQQPLDFKRIIAKYLTRWEQYGPVAVTAVSTWFPGKTSDSNGLHDGTPPPPYVNIIHFYNKIFIHDIKNYALEIIKPKLLAAIETQLSTPARQLPPAPTQPTFAAQILRSPLPLPPNPAPAGPPTPAHHQQLEHAPSHDTPSGRAIPASPSLYSPLKQAGGIGIKSAGNHRFHPYAASGAYTPLAGAVKGLAAAVGSSSAISSAVCTPLALSSSASATAHGGAGANHGLSGASIHGFISPRKLQVPSTNIYLSRLSATGGSSSGSLTPGVLSAGGGSRTPGRVGAHSSAASVASTSRISAYTPTKSRLGSLPGGGAGSSSARVTQSAREDDAVATLHALPASPVPPLHPRAPEAVANAAAQHVPLTPLSRQLYAFGESPRKALDDINALVNGNSQTLVAANNAAILSGFGTPQPHGNSRLQVPGSGSSMPGSGSGRNRSARQLFATAS
jgi:hypothetical protein